MPTDSPTAAHDTDWPFEDTRHAPLARGEPQPARAEATDPSGRRRCDRRPGSGGAWAACRRGADGRGPDLALALMDVSATGVRLLVRAALSPGEEVSVELHRRGEPPLRRLGRVRWGAERDPGAHCVGVEFAQPLGEAQALLFSACAGR